MCTVTICTMPDCLSVTMNRDELRSRAVEVPPAEQVADSGFTWLAPRDGERGGTWIAVNNQGVVGSMTNGPMPVDAVPRFSGAEVPSRGEILPKLMALGGVGGALRFLRERFRPQRYPPFRLILASIDESWSYSWSIDAAIELVPLKGPWVMVSSSVWHTEAVDRYRQKAFQDWLRGGAALQYGVPAFHLMFDPEQPELSPRMERPLSRTRSITQVQVRTGEALMRYAPLEDVVPVFTEYRLRLDNGGSTSR